MKLFHGAIYLLFCNLILRLEKFSIIITYKKTWILVLCLRGALPSNLILAMSLGSKYREVIQKQHSILKPLADKLFDFGLWVLLATIVVFLLVGGAGILLSLKQNEDSGDLMAPVDSVYYQRYEKYKDVFAENSDDFYQPQWIMSGLGMYLSVVIYARDDEGRPIAENDIRGLDTMNEFFEMVEKFRSSDNKSFTELCARHEALPNDKCYRMNVSEIAREEYRKGPTSLLKMLSVNRGTPRFTLDFPSQKATLGDSLLVVSTSEILGSNNTGEDGLKVDTCEKTLGQTSSTYTAYCQYVGDFSKYVSALRYAWHLRYETEEERSLSHQWLTEMVESCGEFERKLNKDREDGEPYWEFMCYHSLTLSDGARSAILVDVKWIVIALFLSLILPVLLIVKPCGTDNFSMLVLVSIGLFFVTLICALGVGSMMGFELAYSFIVSLLFLLWIFIRQVLHVVESLKDFLLGLDTKKDVEKTAFVWLCGHWTFVSLSNLVVLSLTSFLVCCCMYKIVWFTSGFFGAFFLVTGFALFGLLLAVAGKVLKSRSEGGRPCCMGKEVESEPDLDNGLVKKVKTMYREMIIEGSSMIKGVIVAVFLVIFVVCVLYSCLVFMAEEYDDSYYGYDRTQMLLPDDNAVYMLQVLKKYYPNNGPLIQFIFDKNAKYHHDNDSSVCEPYAPDPCMFHIDLLNDEFFPAFWNSSENMWDKWLLSFYHSTLLNIGDDAENKLNSQEDVAAKFVPAMYKGVPLHSLYNDLVRLNPDQLESPPYAPPMEGDPYTRMIIRQKYLSNTNLEVKLMKDLEQAQQKLAEEGSVHLKKYFPPESVEMYSNLFVMYESSRDILTRTLFIPPAVIGCLIFTLFCACVSLPHPMAHVIVFLNMFMLFFEFFALQVLLGTTVNNFSMTYFFLMFIFAVEYSLTPVHINLKHILCSGSLHSPSPSPIPSLVIFVIAFLSFLLMLIVSSYSLVGVAIRNCIFVFGIVGPLHELLFVPAISALLVCSDHERSNEKIVYDVQMDDVDIQKNKETHA